MPREFQFACPLPNGLHARPATALAKAAAGWASQVRLTNLRTAAAADATSVLELVSAAVMAGDVCRMEIDGSDAEQASSALQKFVERELPGCDEPLPEVETVAAGGIPRVLAGTASTIITGLPVSDGIGRGMLVRLGGLALPEDGHASSAADPAAELASARRAFDQVIAGLDEPEPAATETAREIRQALLALVSDPGLYRAVARAINDNRATAARAIVQAVREYSARLAGSGSAYLRERIADLEGLGISLLEQLPGIEIPRQAIELSKPSILAAQNMAANQLLSLDRSLVQGIALEGAGATSHVVILARSFGIPCITGVAQAGALPAGLAVIDGTRGWLATPVTPDVQRFYERELGYLDRIKSLHAASAESPVTTLDGQRVELAANISTAGEAAAAAQAGADGVGLFRTEMLFTAADAEPAEDEQFEVYSRAVIAMQGRPVIIRTLDIGGDKLLPYLKLPAESNPFLGNRGIRVYRDHPGLFRRQLRAIVRASACGKAWAMAPMVSGVGEARWFRQQVAEVQAELKAGGIPFDPDMPVGIMVEVPSAALVVDQLCEVVDFFSVGTNDLTQYLLAVERGNPAVAELYEELHPALLRLLRRITGQAHSHGKWIGLCGELARNPHYAPLLLGLGFDELSMSIPAIPAVRRAAAGVDSEGCTALADRALQCGDAGEVRAELSRFSQSANRRPLTGSELIAVDADCISKAEAIRELCVMNFIAQRCHGADELESAVWEREETYSTGLGHGIAIPHCKADSVLAGSLAVLKLAQPVEWGSLDDAPVDIVIMLAMPAADPGNRHLKVFASLSRRLMHEEFRAGLRNAADADSILSFLNRELEPELDKGPEDA